MMSILNPLESTSGFSSKRRHKHLKSIFMFENDIPISIYCRRKLRRSWKSRCTSLSTHGYPRSCPYHQRLYLKLSSHPLVRHAIGLSQNRNSCTAIAPFPSCYSNHHKMIYDEHAVARSIYSSSMNVLIAPIIMLMKLVQKLF